MSATEEFKEKILKGEIFEALTLAMSEATELEVTTSVSNAAVEELQPGEYLRTRINLVGGEIENEIGSKFLQDEKYRPILQLHLQQVKGGHQTLLNNLESLQQMLGILKDVLVKLPTPATEEKQNDR